MVSDGGAELPPEIAHIARDPLDPEFDDDAFVRRVRKRRLRRSSGSCSTRPWSRASATSTPTRRCGGPWSTASAAGDRLTAAQVRDLLGQAREVMVAALGEGGTSFDALYVNVNGQSGYFDRSLHAYGQEGGPCDRCGTPDPPGRLHEPVVVLLPGLPAAPRADARAPVRTGRDRRPREIDRRGPGVSPLKTAPSSGCQPYSGRLHYMAKALLGTFHSDLRTAAHLLSENTRLRVRVRELEDLVARLQDENDRLAQAEAVALLDLQTEELRRCSRSDRRPAQGRRA